MYEKVCISNWRERRIGSAISKQLIQDGYTVYVHYNNSEEKVNELQKEWGEVIPVQANLASTDGAEQL